MIETGRTPVCFAQVRADTARCSLARPQIDHDFFALMRRSGSKMVMIGIEAIIDDALAQIAKRQSVANIKETVVAFHAHDIADHAMFVAGLDTDTKTSAEQTATFARRLGVERSSS